MSIPLACDMTAIPPADRAEHQRVTRHLVACATDIQESSDGIAFRLPAEEYDTAARFIARSPPGSGAFIQSELHRP